MSSESIAEFSLLKGIGSATEHNLHAAGVMTWQDLSSVLGALAGIRGLTTQRMRELAREAGERAEAGPAPPSEHTESFLVRVAVDSEGSAVRTHTTDVRTQEGSKWPGWAAEAVTAFIESHAGLGDRTSEESEQPGRRRIALAVGKVMGGGPRDVPLTLSTDALEDVGTGYRVVLEARPFGTRRPAGAPIGLPIGVKTGRLDPPHPIQVLFEQVPVPQGLNQLVAVFEFEDPAVEAAS